MARVFLSHSSKDKEYVRRVAEQIGLDHCIIDECEFEAGMKNIDEIFRGLDKTDIFVYFISEFSLSSSWVDLELNNAVEKMGNQVERLKQIYPIIIDKSIQFSDNRIADFLKKGMSSYNLRHILKPEIACRKIKTQIVKLYMDNDDNYGKAKNFFYGRDLEKIEFKKKIEDVLCTDVLKCIVVSGIPGIGRKSLVKATLKDTELIEPYYFPMIISLERTESIDDLIRKLLDMGVGEYSLSDISCIIEMDKKIEILAELIREIQEYHEFLMIDDSQCLVGVDGNIKYWFEKAIGKIKPKLSVSIISEVKLDYIKYRNKCEFQYLCLEELSKTDSLGMLRLLSKNEGIEFNREDREYVSRCLSGYPPQIEFCVFLAKNESVEYVKDNLFMIDQMPEQISSEIIELAYDGENIEKVNCLLALITKFNNMPVTLLNKITNVDIEYRKIFTRLRALSICNYVGLNNEYVKMNSFLLNFVQRNRFDVLPDIKDLILKNIDEFSNKIADEKYTDELDFSEMNYYIKEMVKKGDKIPEQFLYATVFLQSIIDLYNKKSFEKVINIVKEIKENGKLDSYDEEMVNKIMYYYCLALARKKSCLFETEVTIFQKDDTYITYNFLKGYNYRIRGDFEKAENSYRNVLKRNPQDMKTRRELVFIYISNQEYDLALELAKGNYKQNKNNIYYIQAYFDCLIYKKNRTEEETIYINDIISMIKKIYQNIKINSMYYQVLAKYEEFINKNLSEAVTCIEEGIRSNQQGTTSYLLKDLFDIYEHDGNLDGMKSSFDRLKKELSGLDMDDVRFKNVLATRQAILDAYSGKSKTYIEMSLNNCKWLTNDSKIKLLKRVEYIIC